MNPEYKKVKVIKEHCPTCKEQLMGNNSMVLPWQCSCGIWKVAPNYHYDGTYIIVKKL